MQQDKNKELIIRGHPLRLSAGFSTEMSQARREKQDKSKVPKGKNPQLQVLYPVRLSFKRRDKEFPRQSKTKIQHY